MNAVLVSLISTLLVSFGSRLALQAEILALRHQLNILQGSSNKRRRLRTSDLILWVWLSQLRSDWRSALLIVKPETVIRWHRQAFPWDTAPRYLLRDRDSIYGETFRRLVTSMGISEVLTAPRSPWQSPYVERLIVSIRRECLDHIVVLGEESLRRTLRSYIEYYNDSRCQLALNKDSPEARVVQPPDKGRVVEIPKVGGLHHRYE
jgi:hypothetical protein